MHIALAALVIPLAFAPPSWPQSRGPEGTGAAAAAPPVTWSETKNVHCKVPLPGLGHSSPIVRGDRIFLTTSVATGDVTARAADTEHYSTSSVQKQQFVVLCVARQDGRVIWGETVAEAAPHDVRHVTASDASASPVTDGTHVWASFGSRGLYCLDLAGNVVWKAGCTSCATTRAG